MLAELCWLLLVFVWLMRFSFLGMAQELWLTFWRHRVAPGIDKDTTAESAPSRKEQGVARPYVIDRSQSSSV